MIFVHILMEIARHLIILNPILCALTFKPQSTSITRIQCDKYVIQQNVYALLTLFRCN